MDSSSGISSASRGVGFHTARVRSPGTFATFDPSKVQDHIPAFIPFQSVAYTSTGAYRPETGHVSHRALNIFA